MFVTCDLSYFDTNASPEKRYNRVKINNFNFSYESIFLYSEALHRCKGYCGFTD